ncbi:unnamed protein product [Chilo suppressalis]|uniref:DUF4806 domain-containing protein n=1 Tax=Chilo suppressalis TaxID=168631 RepID=A0ABN8L2R8_CHISP|nr:unnamed protein product [Chilo suppressalis]
MPFLIVETIENGSKKLSVCPEIWVNNGILSWPTKKNSKKCKMEQKIPKDSWLKIPCIIKRRFDSYEAADAELDVMVELPETENEGNNTVRLPGNEDFNNIAIQLSSTGSANDNNASTTAAQKMQETNNNISPDNYVVVVSDDVPNGNNITVQNNIENEVLQVLDCDDLLQNQKKMAEYQVAILDNQKKIIKALATISVKIDTLASKFQNQPQMTPPMTVTPLNNEIKKSPYNARVAPVQTMDDLQNMENQLHDAERRKCLKDLYSVFCTPGKKGEVCAFQLIDVFFSREFLVQCSWSGSARGAGSKICIKIFQEVLGFFFELVHDCDPTYTVDKNNDFFKSIVKNAKKRTHSKLGRASAPRNVPKRKLATKEQSCTTKKRRPSGGSSAALQHIEEEVVDIEVVIDKEASIDNAVHADESTHKNENDKN